MLCTLQLLFSLSPAPMRLGVAILLLDIIARVGLVTLVTVSAIWWLVLAASVMTSILIRVPILPLLAVATLEALPIVLTFSVVSLFPVVFSVSVPV